MTFLADACALIAFHGYGGGTMTRAGRQAMIDGDVFVSPITVWEISRKVSLGKLERPDPPDFRGGLADYLRYVGYRFAPLTWQEAEAANALPTYHKDPMDRMLIVTAVANGLTIITDDQMIPRYGVKTIW